MISQIEKEIETLKSIRDKMIETEEYGLVMAMSNCVANLLSLKKDFLMDSRALDIEAQR